MCDGFSPEEKIKQNIDNADLPIATDILLPSGLRPTKEYNFHRSIGS